MSASSLNTAVSVDVKARLTIRGQDFVLTLEELRALHQQIGAAMERVKQTETGRNEEARRKFMDDFERRWREAAEKARPYHPQRPWEIPPQHQRGPGWPVPPPVTCVAVI